MKIIVHCGFSADSIENSVGKAAYSYYFVMMDFLPVLEQMGTVIVVDRPEEEVDILYDQCRETGESCVFLCFLPPQMVPITLRCPTIPVIAWEFTTLPCIAWDDDPRNDWRTVFRHCGRVITLSGLTARLVRDAMGEDFPVFAIPAPCRTLFARMAPALAPDLAPRDMTASGTASDSETPAPTEMIAVAPEPQPEPVPEPVPVPETTPPVEVAPQPKTLRARVSITVSYIANCYRDAFEDLLPPPVAKAIAAIGSGLRRTYHGLTVPPPAVPCPIAPAAAPEPAIPQPQTRFTVNGVVYSSVLSPKDGRKNWHDLLTAFAYAFRDEERATLIVKMPKSVDPNIRGQIDGTISRLRPFRCRIILLEAFLDDRQYADLVGISTYYVNCSSCEGLCLPLTEFLSAGKPAIAPDHTAMADYIGDTLAFRVRSSLEHNVWPHDPRDIFTTMRYRIDWSSLVDAFQESFRVATSDGARYGRMARNAQLVMAGFCSPKVVRDKLAAAVPALAPMAAKKREAAE